jgi:hypothetical protein
LIEIVAASGPALAHWVMLDPEALAGCTILLAADDMFTGEYVRECLCGSGARVIGPARTVRQLAELAEVGEEIDCSLISLTLAGQDTTEIVAALHLRPAPVVVILRRGQRVDGRLAALPSLSSPFGGFQAVDEVVVALRQVSNRPGGSSISEPT